LKLSISLEQWRSRNFLILNVSFPLSPTRLMGHFFDNGQTYSELFGAQFTLSTGTRMTGEARMTGPLEQPESWNDRKARKIGTTRLIPAPIYWQNDCSFLEIGNANLII
jgi:hypothetical protein